MDQIDEIQHIKPSVYLYGSDGKRYDITSQIDGIQWSGDYQQVSRKLELDVLYPVNDYNHQIVIPDTGNIITLVYSGSELFRGVVWSRDIVENSQFMKITCYDGLIHLTKSTTSYNLKNTTPEATTQRICSDFGIPVGNIASTGVNYNDAALGKNYYEIIMAGYTVASKVTGKKYMPRMSEGKLNVIEKGETYVSVELNSGTNVNNVESSENLDGMINKVIIYDESGNIVDSVVNQGWIDSYGLLQDAIQQDKNKDNKAIANKKLKDMERKVQVDALGIAEAITGNSIRLYSAHSGATGLFFIDGDQHSWKNGVYQMTLVLDFQNIMDEKDVTEESSKDSSSNSSSDDLGFKIVAYAKKFIGVPYVYGGTTPNGFDCSGFVQYVFKHFDIDLPRTTYEQINSGTSVSQDELKPGDLVFPNTGHVQIYVGDGQVIHAPHTGDKVKVADMYGFNAGRRVI